MSHAILPSQRAVLHTIDDLAEHVEESHPEAAWLSVVTAGVKRMRYGVIQIVVHESKVVQIERTERTRFATPQSVGRR